jgi:hypothetical protein
MEKSRSSPLLFLFPWLSPRVIKFALTNGGIEVQLWRNNRLLRNWHPSQLHGIVPESLSKWMSDNHIHESAQPYPLVKQVWHALLSVASKKLIIDSSVLAELEEVSQPQDFALTWTINHNAECLEGRYEAADGYLGMGWFHKGAKIWSLNKQPSITMDSQLKNPVLPLEGTDFLLNSIIPSLQEYLPICTDFRHITNFAVRVMVSDARFGELRLALESNYPQFLPTIQIPQQKIDVLLAHQAILRFPHQALTPVLMHLFQNGGSPIIIQGTGIPLFISEQLPAMRQFSQISDETAAKITQSNLIVSISSLKPTFTVSHTYDNGIGLYSTTATYQYQQYTLDMNALLAAYRQNQRFIQQCGVWFEWPYMAHDLANVIQQNLAIRALRTEEVMGINTQHSANLSDQLPAHSIQPAGTTPVERAQSIFEQLRYHGIPGGIVDEPIGLTAMFANACEKLLQANHQARILWLIPSNKKGLVTRTIHNSSISSYVTVASLVTLRDEPALMSHLWTLVIFQGLDVLMDGSPPSRMLAQLKWSWALISISSKLVRNPSIMPVLHLPEQYYEQFHVNYLFELNQETKQASEQSLVQPAASTHGRVLGNEVKRIEQKVSSIPFMEQRVTILQQYWPLFEKIHERQVTGMKPLWGLVEDSRMFDFERRFSFNEPYQFQLYLHLLPSTLLTEIERLWGTSMLPRWPECIISEPFPHQLFAETFGQALKFWHGCALTAWFFCEGPSSRTSLASLAEYYHKDIQVLKEMGTPINERIFEDLARAEARLGQPQSLTRQVTTRQGHFCITITSTRSYGTRRNGFEKLRDIISFYRHQWAKNYLDQYLQKRWETEIHEATHSYKLYVDQRSAPPTAKQFAKDAKTATNHWFGGDISGLYSALQEQSPIRPRRLAILPADRVGFAFTVFKKFSPSSRQKSPEFSLQDSQIERLANNQYYQLNKLAALSFWYVQLEEALGHTPTLQEFGSSKFGQSSQALHEDINQAWKIFSNAIDAAKQAFPTPKGAYKPLKNQPASIKPERTQEYTNDELEGRKATLSLITQPVVHLNQETILKLQEESEQLHNRLILEEEASEQLPIISIGASIPPAPMVRQTRDASSEVDEDWQIILQHWQPEHWELLRLLCLGQPVQLTTVERKDRRPISLLIDEINVTVDEHISDLLIDPDTQTLSPHLRVIAENLVSWYYSKGR